MSKKRNIPNPCAYCGQKAILTLDHVIPKCLFNGTRPNNIPTVNACPNCNNNQKSLDDSYLRDMLVNDRDAASSIVAQQIYRGPGFRSILKLKSAMFQDLASASIREGFTSTGISVPIPHLPDNRTRKILSTVVRGLAFSYQNLSIPKNINIDIIRCSYYAFKSEIENFKLSGIIQKVGDGKVFWCMYVPHEEHSNLNQWYLCFYERVTYFVFLDFSNFNLVH